MLSVSQTAEEAVYVVSVVRTLSVLLAQADIGICTGSKVVDYRYDKLISKYSLIKKIAKYMFESFNARIC